MTVVDQMWPGVRLAACGRAALRIRQRPARFAHVFGFAVAWANPDSAGPVCLREFRQKFIGEPK